MTLYDSNPVFDRVSDLAACLCAQIADPENGVPDVCFCGIMPGDQAVGDYGGDCKVACGLAWVRLVSLYPMAVIGAPDPTPGNCGVGVGIDVEMGIMRCISIGNDVTGELPSAAELLEAAQLQFADALVMRKALFCCDAIPTKEGIMTVYTPAGPMGGLVGGTVTVSLGTE